MEKEIWRDIAGYEGLYQVSNYGQVKSLNYRHTKKAKQLVLYKDKGGYLFASLSLNGHQRFLKVHRLVWEAFNGPIPEGYEINHIDEDKTNNHLDNISLVTRKENLAWGTWKERMIKTKQNTTSLRKPVIQYDLEGNYINEYQSACEAARQTGITRGNISSCCRGELPYTKGFIWRFK